MPATPGKDQQQIRRVLRDAVKASRLPVREIERALRLGSGRLEDLLEGTIELRVRHLVALAELLRVPPGDFLELGFPEATRGAEHRLAEWIGPPRPKFKAKSRAAAAPALPDELATAIRAAVRQELEATGRRAAPDSTEA